MKKLILILLSFFIIFIYNTHKTTNNNMLYNLTNKNLNEKEIFIFPENIKYYPINKEIESKINKNFKLYLKIDYEDLKKGARPFIKINNVKINIDFNSICITIENEKIIKLYIIENSCEFSIIKTENNLKIQNFKSKFNLFSNETFNKEVFNNLNLENKIILGNDKISYINENSSTFKIFEFIISENKKEN